jgi:hypothetical protein
VQSTPCSANGSISTTFNSTNINSGSYIWFNAIFAPGGIPSSGGTVTFTNSTISFTSNGHNYNLSVPDAQVTFSPSVNCTTTTFDSSCNMFKTTSPLNYDEVWLTGVSFAVPANFCAGSNCSSIAPVWSGKFGFSNSGMGINYWEWGAAVYTTFSINYGTIAPKPGKTNSCSYSEQTNHAGTPEGADPQSGHIFQNFVVAGATGSGGTNYNGNWSGSQAPQPSCP